MKSTLRFAAVITALTMTFSISLAKTRYMTVNYYNQLVNKTDSSVIGTWERNSGIQKIVTTVYCQFNANGTFISFERTQNKYKVTGTGKWMINNGTINIIHGTEISVPVVYQAQENRLVFGDKVFYTKLTAEYAGK